MIAALFAAKNFGKLPKNTISRNYNITNKRLLSCHYEGKCCKALWLQRARHCGLITKESGCRNREHTIPCHTDTIPRNIVRHHAMPHWRPYRSYDTTKHTFRMPTTLLDVIPCTPCNATPPLGHATPCITASRHRHAMSTTFYGVMCVITAPRHAM